MNGKSLFNIARRNFSIYNYSSASNPRVYLSVANGEKNVGEMVFELYHDSQPTTSENFRALCESGYSGSAFHQGMSGMGVSGGRVNEDNMGAFGVANPDENLSLRHHKRGLLTTPNAGANQNGSEFTITFSEAHYLDGYQNVFGELVSGENVLAELEKHSDRHGNLKGDFTIVSSGVRE